MTTEVNDDEPDFSFDWSEVAKAVFVAKGIKEGLWRVGAHLRFAGVTINWKMTEGQEVSSPTAMVGFEGIALYKAEALGPMVFDATRLVGRKSHESLAAFEAQEASSRAPASETAAVAKPKRRGKSNPDSQSAAGPTKKPKG